MKSLNISVTPLVNGLEQHGEDKIEGYDSEHWEFDRVKGFECDDRQVYRDDKMNKKELKYREEGSCYAVPLEKDDDIHWRSPWLSCSGDAVYDERDGNRTPHSYDYIGQRLKIYWHPVDGDLVKVKPRGWFAGPPLGVLLGETSIPADVRLTETSKTINIDYEVIESNTVEEVVNEEEHDDEAENNAVEDESEEQHDDEDESKAVEEVESEEEHDDENESNDVAEVESEEEHDDEDRSHNGNNEEKIIQKSGCIKIHKVTIDFAALVHQHALILERQLRRQNSKIKQGRPLSPSEEAYYSLVSLAALKNAK